MMTATFGKQLNHLRGQTKIGDNHRSLSLEQFSEHVRSFLKERNYPKENYPGKSTVDNWEKDKSLPPASERDVILGICWTILDNGGGTISDINSMLVGGGYAQIQLHEYTLLGLNPPKNIEKISHGDNRFYVSVRPAKIIEPIFVGRDKDREEIISRMNTFPAKSLYIVGLPGVGKTRLANQLAYNLDLLSLFPEGILYTALGERSDMQTLLQRWLNSVDSTYQSSRLSIGEIVSNLQRILQDKRILLIVDDIFDGNDILPFEQFRGKGCGIIYTTRFPKIPKELGISPDYVHRLATLSDSLTKKLIKDLFPNLLEQSEDQIDRLLPILGGLPLATVVIANQLKVESSQLYEFKISEIIDEIMNTFALLEARTEDPVTRTLQTIEALLKRSLSGSSHKLINHGFARISVFKPNPAIIQQDSLEAFFESDSEIDNPKTIIRQLVDHGLLQPVPTQSSYTIHSILSLYAEKIARQQGLYESSMHLLVSTFEQLLQFNDANVKSSSEAQGVENFSNNWEQINHVFDWISTNIPDSDFARTMCISFVNHGINLLTYNLHPNKRIRWIEQAIKAAQYDQNQEDEQRLLGNLAIALGQLAEYDKAISIVEQALQTARNIADEVAIARHLNALGTFYMESSNLSIAEKYLTEARDFADKIEAKDLELQQTVMGNLATVYALSGEFGKAVIIFEELITTVQKPQNKALALGNAGLCYFYLGDYEPALTYSKQALHLSELAQDKVNQIQWLDNLGQISLATQQNSLAVQLFERAIDFARELGDKRNEAQILEHLADVYIQQGDVISRKKILTQARDIFSEISFDNDVKRLTQIISEL